MAMISVGVEGVDVRTDALQAACLLRGLSDPSRLIVVHHLLLGEHRVVELTEHLGLAQSTVSKHLACLVECGLVTFRAEGRSSVYSLAYPEETVELLAATEKLLMLTNAAATACPTVRHN